jgi:hypothetical protein
MGAERLLAAATGGAFAGYTSAEVLKFLLGMIFVSAAFKRFGGAFDARAGLNLPDGPSSNLKALSDGTILRVHRLGNLSVPFRLSPAVGVVHS